MTYKNIRIPKRGGGTRIQRVKVLASGKYKFVKNLGSKLRKVTKRSKKTKRRKTYMARRKRRRRTQKFTIPIAPVAGIIAGVARQAPSGSNIPERIMRGDINGLLYDMREVLAGVDNNGKIHFDWLVATYGPMVAGILIHKFVGGPPLNLNRTLANAGVPFIRI